MPNVPELNMIYVPMNQVWHPEVLKCSALESSGISDIWEVVLKHKEILETKGLLEEKRRIQSLEWMKALVEEGIMESFYRNKKVQALLQETTTAVEKGDISASTAASRILNNFRDIN